MPFPNILNKAQIKEFDNPPIFKSEDRKIFFDIPRALENEFLEIRNNTNKLVFIIMIGYFKCCKKFFIPIKFNEKDINYVVNKYNLEFKDKKLKDFSRTNIYRYKDIILRHFSISEFDNNAKNLLKQEARNVVQKEFKMRAIFQGLLNFLCLKKIEIPNYNVLAEIITNTLNEYEKDISFKLSNLLDNDKKDLLDDLLQKIQTETIKGKKYNLTNLIFN